MPINIKADEIDVNVGTVKAQELLRYIIVSG